MTGTQINIAGTEPASFPPAILTLTHNGVQLASLTLEIGPAPDGEQVQPYDRFEIGAWIADILDDLLVAAGYEPQVPRPQPVVDHEGAIVIGAIPGGPAFDDPSAQPPLPTVLPIDPKVKPDPAVQTEEQAAAREADARREDARREEHS